VKKWIFTLLLWYIFVDNTPWIQDPEKKTVWILKPGWSTYQDCWDFKVKIFEILNGENKKYICVDMDYQKPPVDDFVPGELVNRLRLQLEDLIKQLRRMSR